MSRVTRRKHVIKEMFDDNFDLPKENQQIVRVVSSRGNNLHEVEPATADPNFLVSMPTKFRRNVWVKRGDFILVEPIEEGDKVKAEIIRILTPEHVKVFTQEGVWPKQFTRKRELSENSDEDEDGLCRNMNRVCRRSETDEETDESDEEVNSSESEEEKQ